MGDQLIWIGERSDISDLGRQMQRMEDDLGSFVFLYTSIFFAVTPYLGWTVQETSGLSLERR